MNINQNISPHNLHLAIYGDGKVGFIQAAERLKGEALSSGWFSSVSKWSQYELQQLDPNWASQHAQFIENNSRGNGYWLWKPKLIELMLNGLPEDDILVYVDAGSELNLQGQERFHQYADLADKYGLLAFFLNKGEPNRKVRQWTKKDLLNKFNLSNGNEPILDAPQIESGLIFLKNTPISRCFVQEWLSVCESEQYSHLTDIPSRATESMEFIEHRHDQAIFTLLLFKYKYGMVILNENFFPELRRVDKHPSFAPFALFRNATGTRKLEQMSLIDEPEMGGVLSELNWFHQFNLLNDDTQKIDGKKLNIEDWQTKSDNRRISILETLKDLQGKSQIYYYERDNNLFKSYLNDSTKAILNLQNNLIKKEEVIRGLKLALDQRLIVLNEKEEVIQALKKVIPSFQEKNAHQEKNFITVWLDYRRIAKFIFPEKFLMPLRRLKHSIVQSLSHDYGTHYIKQLQHTILHSPLNFRKIYIGQLRHHEPKINPNYRFVGKAIARPSIQNSLLPTISIVTPSFNQGIYLENTINSIITQNYPHLDYWVQDGGSTDTSGEILQRYQSALAGYEIKNDAGQAQAVNLGFKRSNGEIMAWVNSDDLLMPGSLHFVGHYFRSHPEVDVLYSNRILINENNHEIGRWVLPKHDDGVLPWADYVPQETLFWRRQIWNKIGASLDESFQFAMDWDLLLRFQTSGAKFCHVSQFLGCFRVHSLQKTSTQLHTLGLNEMDRLRKRNFGFIPNQQEIDRNLQSFYRKHIYADRLSRMMHLFYDGK